MLRCRKVNGAGGNFLQIIKAIRSPCCLPRHLYGGQQQSGQQGDDRDHDQHFDDSERAFQETLRRYALERLAPDYARWDSGEALPRERIRAFAELGFWKVRLTGGEPTVRSDIVRIAEMSSKNFGRNFGRFSVLLMPARLARPEALIFPRAALIWLAVDVIVAIGATGAKIVGGAAA